MTVLRIPGICLIRYGRTSRHRNDCHEEVVYTHRYLEIGGTACHTGKQQGHSGGRGSKGEMWARGLIVDSKGKNKGSRVNGFGTG